MSAAAISRATRELAQALQRALLDAGEPGSVFVGPLDDPGARGAALILLLYRIVPNASLRNSEHRVPAPDPDAPPVVHLNALPLDLYYLITVGNDPGNDDHLLRVLGIAIQALNEFPHLSPGGPDPVHASIEPLSTEEISRIWALFPTVNYRTSVCYVLSPVWVDPRTQTRIAPAVVHDAPLVGAAARSGHA
jgi:hypothetical protein